MLTLPEAFQFAMKNRLGNQYPDFESCLNQPPPVSLRINPSKNAPTVSDDAVLWSAFGRYLDARPNFTLDPLFHAGCYYVQEASSMFLEQVFRQLVNTDESLNILDLSAAPGGKSTHLLSLINEKSLLVSNEVIRSRASILNENICKWGHANVMVTNNDPEDFKALPGFFDMLVIDAPCSGEGLFRKDPAAANEWSAENVALCSARQKRILADAWPSLKENGLAVFCTCTFNEYENESNLAWLLEEYAPEFLKLRTEKYWGIEEVSLGKTIGYRFYPHRVRGEGFFISVMRKKETTPSSRSKLKPRLTVASKKFSHSLSPWLNNAEQFDFYQHNEFIYILPKEKVQEAALVSQHLKIVNAGTTITSVKHEKFIPDHALALSIHLKKENFTRAAFDYDDSIRFLRKDVLNPIDAPKGFCLITYKDIPLGWVNNLGTRLNNLYPNEWRIRMDPKR